MSTRGRGALDDRFLYLCTGDRPDLGDFVSECILGGVDVVQLREPSLDARPLLERCDLLRQVCADHGVPFIVNDRADIALAIDADGVHLGQDDIPPAVARAILGDERIIGLSTHQSSEFFNSRAEPVSYISAGPVVETPTKPGRRGTGISYIREVARELDAEIQPAQPFYVTGGVSPESIPQLVEAGATRFVVVRYLTESNDPRGAARRLRAAIDQSIAGLASRTT